MPKLGWCFFILQTTGQFQSQLASSRSDLAPEDQSLSCLTAVILDGAVLWRNGEPYAGEAPYTSHAADDMVAAADWDDDRTIEIALVRNTELVMISAATGKTKRRARLPADNFVRVHPARLDPKANGLNAVCSVNDIAYEPWSYANPTVIYNPDLSVYQEPFEVRGAGHNMVAMDINGDGELEVRYAGSEDTFVADMHGNVLWSARAGHSQTTIQGAWGPAGETRIIMSEKNRGLWGFDMEGTVLWNRQDINGYACAVVQWPTTGGLSSWALFRPQRRPSKTTPYYSSPSWYPALWPRFIDGDGSMVDVFPWKDEYAQPAELIRAGRSYDCGVRYGVRVLDLDEDGYDEVVIFNRRRILVFGT